MAKVAPALATREVLVNVGLDSKGNIETAPDISSLSVRHVSSVLAEVKKSPQP